MTDRIDLDELDVGEDDEETEDANPGDWLWRGEGTPEDEPEPPRTTGPAVERSERDSTDSETAGAESDEPAASDDVETDADTDPSSQPAPHVPRANRDRPVGIPTQSGGAGAGDSSESEEPTAESGEATAEPRPAGSAAEGPHGGGVDDMTMAFTYRAVRRLAAPAAAFADASTWADWIGIVGDVETHAITKFQRTHAVDADFFTGSGTNPAERLREIDRTSMFYAERMVVVGVEGDEWIAESAGWEFVPLETAAEKADWELES
ncbi:hypothetical protein CV102_13080 [Natronococcus pandeyae]|uniref:DUF7124 domain-containing protein n=1 Tax=Natronococcus pandeyae TaxID=2055836 RepID=A0A8J8Q388_9EURY|nr:hypothetical protein [Natronococcus pandeyae]TYL38134.1 hypothetical protein CV102_13080 [Natronococcus pandeyae]